MEPLLLRLSEPRELLALVPHLLGFQPRDSAVAVSLRGPRGRVGLVARVDLADVADAVHGPQVARSLAAHLDRDGARRVALVVYARDAPGSGERVAAAAAHTLEAFDVPFGGADVLVVGDTTFRCLACDPTCCPPTGHPLSALQGTRAGAEMVLAGSVVAAGREQLAEVRAASADARRAVARVRRRRCEARARARVAGPQHLARWRADSLAAWRALVAAPAGAGAGRVTRIALLGRVEAGLADRRVRDAVLVACLPGAGTLPERALALAGPDEDAEVRAAVGRLVDPAGCVAPGDGARTAAAVLEEVLAHGRRGAQAPASTLLAAIAWWRGDGARAAVLLERALQDDPGYRLGHLLRAAVEAGLAPGWARRQEAGGGVVAGVT
ncbi:conserved hypothetical protein [Cellulomonas flavigena DSM 20109]|uniref:DUF4192 domain-containing protein n=1 Tax=Cellulomonas flavigena (strain ATCC 482 / DSM 20109 / BCRC 11376 / JCM 18109 / NBRC 3775 / NCIMB 8073 / NRS 134) TaxID=446466 RepID=D5UFF7_CELFN|nr:DUF4192 domain-containing protein [Cellulomonas flavigena]ADG74954.1 conserved hypothetical protein [Cellulomonas flavigena DSM 20109]